MSELDKIKIRNLQELRKNILSVWRRIDSGTLLKLANSFLNRLSEVKTLGGSNSRVY
jgi:hypothetical protein